MSSELPNYVEQAKLHDTAVEEIDVLKDPSKFDEAAMRKAYKDRLDRVVGGRVLNDALFRKYQEALKKIEENIAKLKELKAYALSREKIAGISETVKTHTRINNGVEYVIYFFDYKFLDNFLKNPPKHLHAMLEYTTKDRGAAEKAREKVGGMLDEYYARTVKNLGQDELNRVKNVTTPGGLQLLDYVNLEDKIDDLKELVVDKFLGAKNPQKYLEIAQKRIAEMSDVLKGSVRFLNREDKFVLENFQKATQAKERKEKNAGAWWSGALELRVMRFNKQDAERKRVTALALGADPKTYEEAQRAFAEAEKVASRDFKKADELYMRARDLYKQSNEIYLAERAKKSETRIASGRSPRSREG